MFFNLPGSVPMGRLFGIPIRLHLLFLLVLVIQVAGSAYYGTHAMLLWFILLGPVLLLTVLIHELGHCLAARSVGGAVEGILLWPLGGLAFLGHTAGPKADVWVAVAGPLTHIPMVGLWLLILLPIYHANTGSYAITLDMPYYYTSHWSYLAQAVCAGAVVLNVSLFFFNLFVPAYPLDGGRILVDTLLMLGCTRETTAKITMAAAAPIAVAIFVWGCVQFQMVTIMVACFIASATFQLLQSLRAGTLHTHPLFAFTASTPAPGSTTGAVGGHRSDVEGGGVGSSGAVVGNPEGPYYKMMAPGAERSARV